MDQFKIIFVEWISTPSETNMIFKVYRIICIQKMKWIVAYTNGTVAGYEKKTIVYGLNNMTKWRPFAGT